MFSWTVCLNTLFTHLPLVQRVQAVHGTGVGAIEFWGPPDGERAEAVRRARALGLDPVAGSCTLLPTAPSETTTSLERLTAAIRAADAVGVRHMIVRAGARIDGPSLVDQVRAVTSVLSTASQEAARRGVALHLEAGNPVDEPQGLLFGTAAALDVVEAVASPAMDLCYDIYHAQMSEGNLIGTIRSLGRRIGYVHLSDAPGRQEPGRGEIHFGPVLAALTAIGYGGYVELEFHPTGGPACSRDSILQALRVLTGSTPD